MRLWFYLSFIEVKDELDYSVSDAIISTPVLAPVGRLCSGTSDV